MRRLGPAVVLLCLMLAGDAFAQAGGGSSSFGGSSGGSSSSGGGSGSGGSGGDLDLSDPFTIGFLILVALSAVVLLVVFIWVGIATVHFWRKRRQRAARVEAAAVEAAEDDPAFAAETVHWQAKQLFLKAQSSWDDRDRDRLRKLVSPELMVEWERRLDDFERKGWHNRVAVRGEPSIEYLGLVNRERDEEDRAVVRIVAKIDTYVIDENGDKQYKTGEDDASVTLREYWTLSKRDGRWTVAAIEQDSEGAHHVDAKIVVAPWSDDARLSDEAVIELADGLPAGFKPADVADLDFEGDARAAARDLALADGRFAPLVLEAAARRAVEAWADAVDGEDERLEAVASPQAVSHLLYDGDASRKTRLVVRGPRVKSIRIVGLDAQRDPATMTIEVRLGGQRYVEDRDTAAVLSGSKDSASTFTERWTLALDGAAQNPWRLT